MDIVTMRCVCGIEHASTIHKMEGALVLGVRLLSVWLFLCAPYGMHVYI